MQDVITSAIAEKTLLCFRYDGRFCVVEPYALGLSENHLCLHAWQTNGTNAGWRKFHVADINCMHKLEASFVRPRQEPGHEDWRPLYSASVGAHRDASA